MWPLCINNLKPIDNSQESQLPSFLVKAFQERGIVNLQEIFVPICKVSLLGSCGTEEYLECPNLPEWHIENSKLYEPGEYLSDIGKYYWFDFNLVDIEKNESFYRAIFNEGDVDCNDGIWGACWDRNTGILVANFESTGDCESTITLTSSEHLNAYQPHSIWMPFTSAQDADGAPYPFTIYYSKNLEIEKLMGLAIRWCFATAQI